MKPTITRLSAAVLLSSTLLITQAPSQSFAATYEGTVDTKILNVRSSSSTTSSIVGKLTKGSKVTVYSTNNNWAKIEFNGKKRYVSATYLSLKPANNQLTTQSKKEYIARENVNLRSSRTTSSRVITTIPKGAVVSYLASYGATGSWMKVSYKGKTGYVASRYFTSSSATVSKQTASVNYLAQENVNLRSGSSRKASIIGSVPKGSSVSYISSHGSWLKIKHGGKTGYVAAFYFKKIDSGSTTTLAATHSTNASVTMKQGMFKSAKTVTNIPAGSKVTLISLHGASGSWAKVTYNTMTGYIPNRILKSAEKQTIVSKYTQRKTSIYKTKWTGGTVLKTLELNTEVKQLSDLGSWVKVSLGSITGYIPKRDLADTKFVEKITPYFAQQQAPMYVSKWTSSKVIQTIPSGAKVDQLEVYGTNRSWFKVRYANKTGYVAARNFALTPPEKYGTEYEAKIVVPNNAPLNVREKPTTVNSNTVGTLTTGDIVKVKQVLNTKWGMLTAGPLSGRYIHLDYAVPVTVVTPPPSETGNKQQVISYTDYLYSTQRMAEYQVAQIAQTDAHKSKPAYLPRAWVKVSGTTGTITNPGLTVVSNIGTAIKSSASTSATSLATAPKNSKLVYLGRQSVGSTIWYKVRFNTIEGYVLPKTVVGDAGILSEANMTAHRYGYINPGETVTITGSEGTYYTVSYRRPSGHDIRVFDNTWRSASVNDLGRYVDPNNFDRNSKEFYQFLDLSKSAGTTASILNEALQRSGKLSGTLTGKGQAFIDAGKKYGINEVYLLAHAVHETGHGSSLLAKGVPVDQNGTALINSSGVRIYPERKVAATVYNMYGIQAVDSSPLTSGAKYAFEQGWTTPDKAIDGGAYWIGDGYINHSQYKQNTLYKIRFNPGYPGEHQYATDIGWATKQTANIYNMYQQLDAYTLYFEVPKFQ
ncbi:SH3 domain-containing protein [Exiguobacterium aurantiacum]|uniref:SH3 domain-containing protein n=1 Tax=Exiguobacterium aurantiacum TaxID=33987 RepID=UPI00384E358B